MKNISKGKKAFIIIGIILAVILLILDAVLILYAMYPQEISIWTSEMMDSKLILKKWPMEFFGKYAPHKYFDICYDNIRSTTFDDYTLERRLLFCDIYFSTYVGFRRSESAAERGIFSFKDGDGKGFEVFSYADWVCSGYYTFEEVKLDLYDREYGVGEDYLLFIKDKKMMYDDHVLFFAPLDGEYPYIDMHIVSDVSEKDGVKTDSVRYDATYFGAETKNVTKDEFVSLVMEYQEKLIKEERERNKGGGLDPMQCG